MEKYFYKGKVLDVYDGDTLTLLIDCGFNIHFKQKIRLLGIDTPEIRTKNKKEKEMGYMARDYVRSLVLGKNVYFKSEKKGKFGRYLATIYLELHTETLNELLIKTGFARKYDGGKRKPW